MSAPALRHRFVSFWSRLPSLEAAGTRLKSIFKPAEKGSVDAEMPSQEDATDRVLKSHDHGNHTTSANDGDLTKVETDLANIRISTEAAADEPCPLKRLPPELRNQIFKIVCVQPRPIRMMNRYLLPHETFAFKLVNPRSPPTALALASTCRQFNQEVMPVFYTSNQFLLEYKWWIGQPADDALPFQLEKANHLILNFRSCGQPYGTVHLVRDGQQLVIRAAGRMQNHCLCDMSSLAGTLAGAPRLLERFLVQAQRRNGLIDQLVLGIIYPDRACSVCGCMRGFSPNIS